MILLLGEVDFGGNIVICQRSLHCVSLGRSRDVNVAKNGLGVREKDLERWIGEKKLALGECGWGRI
jgi:hypothetical protein